MVDMMHYPANYSHPNLNPILNSKPSFEVVRTVRNAHTDKHTHTFGSCFEGLQTPLLHRSHTRPKSTAWRVAAWSFSLPEQDDR